MIASFIVKRPVVVALLIATLMGLSGWALPRIRTSSLQAFRDQMNVSEQRWNEVQRAFVNDQIVILAYEADDIFSTSSLETVRELSAALKKRKFELEPGEKRVVVEDVLSLTTVSDAYGSEMSFRTNPLVPDPIPTDGAALDDIRRRAMNSPMVRGNLMSEDFRLGSIVVRLQDDVEMKYHATLIRQLRDGLEAFQAPPDFKFHVTGFPVTEADFQTFAIKDVGSPGTELEFAL